MGMDIAHEIYCYFCGNQYRIDTYIFLNRDEIRRHLAELKLVAERRSTLNDHTSQPFLQNSIL